jgi:hypothetical protein
MDLLNGLADYFEVSVSYLVGESLDEEEAELVAMYRDLKKLTPTERERMRSIMKAAFPRKKARSRWPYPGWTWTAKARDHPRGSSR